MIIKGNSRAGAGDLAKHLLRSDTNEVVTIVETHSVDPNPSQALHDSLKDMEILSTGTRGTKGLYHANIDPATDYTMTDDQWLRAVEVLGKELGLDGQPRAIVKHQKEGREHLHVVWQRTDTDQWKFISDSLNYPAHERASRQLEQEFGHELVIGAFTGREPGQPRPISELSHEDWQKMERSGLDPADRRELVRELFEQSDNGEAFTSALNSYGFILAKGERSPMVIVDPSGEIHALRSDFKGIYKAKEIYERLGDVRERLPTTEQAKILQLERIASDDNRHEQIVEPEQYPERVIDEVTDRPTTPEVEVAETERDLSADQSTTLDEENLEPDPEVQPAPIDQVLLEIEARQSREIRNLNAEQAIQMDDFKKQVEQDNSRHKERFSRKLEQDKEKIHQDILKRKNSIPDDMDRELQGKWLELEKTYKPNSWIPFVSKKEIFWQEVQPLLDQHQENQTVSFDERLDARAEFELQKQTNTLEQEASELSKRQSLEIENHIAFRKRKAIEKARELEIRRQREERERQRDRDRDRGRDDR